MAAIVVTADLQGRELFEDSRGQALRLLGEVLPQRLAAEVLPDLVSPASGRIGVLLAGDFYTVPALDRRGGTGDVTCVWQAFADSFDWVAGVPGNHDTFGDPPQRRPRFPSRVRFLDGDVTDISGLRVAGLGGIVGKATRPNHRSEEDYLAALRRLLDPLPDLVLLHDGPSGLEPGQRGLSCVRELLVDAGARLIIRGHAHWDQPFVELPDGMQILNVDARVVVLMNDLPK